MYVKLNNLGDIIIFWRCLIVVDKEILLGEKGYLIDEIIVVSLCLKEDEVLWCLKFLISWEKKFVWVILLVVGGYFVGLVINS